MFGDRVFEIPIYRLSPDEYDRETERLRRAVEEPDKPLVATGLWPSLSDAERATLVRQWQDSFARSDDAKVWLFNDIVGYICLFATPGQIKAEYWYIDAKRLRRDSSHKIFKYTDKLFEIHVLSSDTNADIFAKLLKGFSQANQVERLLKRHLDLEVFHTTGMVVDWRALTSQRTSGAG